MSQKTALIFGSSGEVGGHLLQLLLDNPAYSKVTAVNRRSRANINHPKYKEVVHPDPSSTTEEAEHIYCCIGSKLKTAGSRANYIAIDRDLTVNIAKLAKSNHASFIFISSAEAHPWCPIFYGRIKGQTEEAVRKLHLEKAFAVRPSFFKTHREKVRPDEEWVSKYFSYLDPLLQGPLRKYRVIDSRVVAANMVALLNDGTVLGHMDYVAY